MDWCGVVRIKVEDNGNQGSIPVYGFCSIFGFGCYFRRRRCGSWVEVWNVVAIFLHLLLHVLTN